MFHSNPQYNAHFLEFKGCFKKIRIVNPGFSKHVAMSIVVLKKEHRNSSAEVVIFFPLRLKCFSESEFPL